MNNMAARQKIFLVAIALGVLILFELGLFVSHIGKTRVSITVIPSDATVTIDGKRSSKTAYLKPGNYTVAATKTGWSKDSQNITVGNSTVKVSLVPAPASQAATDFLNNNPDIQKQRETIGGQRANSTGQQLKSNNPIISLLPYTNPAGPFSIDYGPSTTRAGGVIYVISGSTPDGRQNALKWFRDHGQDPTNLDIQYSDFANPLAKAQGAE